MLFSTPLFAGWFGDCDHTADRRVATPSAGVTRVVVIGRAGSLRVTGRGGAAEIAGSGTACSSDADDLKDITLVASRSGSEVRIEAKIPEHNGWGSWSGKLDFEVTLPAGLAVVVHDSSGEATISDVGTADVQDSSGDLTIRGVHGDLKVNDSSGDLTIEDVTGHVSILDSSGGIEVTRAGSVTVEADSSGSIEINHVNGNVVIEEDGSGGVDVTDVGGDFVVKSKGSGHISSDGVRGKVSIPRD